MKTKMLVVLLGSLVLVAGCVSTVNDRSTAAVPFVKDKFEGRYERTPEQVYAAAEEVLKANGAIERESILNPGVNQVRTIEAKMNGRRIWVRVEPVDTKVSSVVVQVRTSGGGADLELTQELQKQIAVKLATR
jgi:outer membrane murein-binding lipoprotein Lpp